MQRSRLPQQRGSANRAGFALPAILVVVGALLILAVGVLLIVGIERNTSRSFVDRQRADLAARAGLEDVKGILGKEAANDDFTILSGTEPVEGSKKDPTPYLYLARGSGGENTVNFRYLPLFSTATAPVTTPAGTLLEAPLATALVGDDFKDISALPWYDPARVAWVEVPDAKGKVVSRYAYWVEDLQGKVNPKVAGNAEGTAGLPKRRAYPEPAAKPLTAESPPLDVIAIHTLDPESGDLPVGTLTQQIIAGRPAMISPDSILGAAAISAPQPRDRETGLLEDPLAAALEKNVTPAIQPYREQPLVPFAAGISKDVAGKPKLNLNELLNKSRSSAVDEFSDWVTKALPEFDLRKGGFPDDYGKTLAANAFDFVDSDTEPTLGTGFRGLDAYPMLSEIALKIEYSGYRVAAGRLLLNWRIKLFGEMWNMTNKPVSGNVSLSYEAALNHTPIGSGTKGPDFDDPVILQDPRKSSHNLTLRDGRYYGPEVPVSLQPNEYRFYQFAQVQAAIDIGANNINYNTKFALSEKLGTRGVSVLWNGKQTERVSRIVRDLGEGSYMEFTILYPKIVGKAGIPSGSYGPYGDFTNNMGDPRMSHYFRERPLGENSLRNLSPNRRNVRLATIYNSDSSTKPAHYGRVLPAEWPDGGQNSSVGSFPIPSDSAFAIEPTDKAYANAPQPVMAEAPVRLSSEGRFYSAAELGHVYDPVMWVPTYPDLKGSPGSGSKDSNVLNGVPAPSQKALMPASRNAWPEIATASEPSASYGGGNTLRIGRPEHQKFDVPGKHAAHLLDLFQAGDLAAPLGEGPEAKTVKINGHINVNTAGRDALRAMAAGMLKQDPELRKVTDWSHDVSSGRLSAKTVGLELGTPTQDKAADKIADAIIRSRPFASMKELACAKDEKGDLIFGNKAMYSEGKNIQWTDSAAEEVFARVHDAATLRSRNFRVWVIGQAVSKVGSRFEVLAESRRAFTIFADPGDRKPDGSIDPLKVRTRVMYENDF